MFPSIVTLDECSQALPRFKDSLSYLSSSKEKGGSGAHDHSRHRIFTHSQFPRHKNHSISPNVYLSPFPYSHPTHRRNTSYFSKLSIGFSISKITKTITTFLKIHSTIQGFSLGDKLLYSNVNQKPLVADSSMITTLSPPPRDLSIIL